MGRESTLQGRISPQPQPGLRKDRVKHNFLGNSNKKPSFLQVHHDCPASGPWPVRMAAFTCQGQSLRGRVGTPQGRNSPHPQSDVIKKGIFFCETATKKPSFFQVHHDCPASDHSPVQPASCTPRGEPPGRPGFMLTGRVQPQLHQGLTSKNVSERKRYPFIL